MQVNSTRQFMRELNRLGLTSAIDAGGGFQNYPEDYEIIEQLHANKQMTVRIAYNLFTQRPKQELEDFERWTDMLKPDRAPISTVLMAQGKCWSSRPLILKISCNHVRICRKVWKKNWNAWFATGGASLAVPSACHL